MKKIYMTKFTSLKKIHTKMIIMKRNLELNDMGFLCYSAKACPHLSVFKGSFLGAAPTSICHFFLPSIRPSVAHHISGTVHHLIIIFGTHM